MTEFTLSEDVIGGGETGAGPADPQAYYDDLVVKHAARTGVNVDFLRAQIDAESSWNPKAIGAGRGAEDRALGIAQILRSEAEKAGVDPYNPDHAIGYMADRAVKALKKYKGNYREVAGRYHGWNQRDTLTRAYQDRVMKFFKQRKPGKRADFSLISSAQAEELPTASSEFTLSDEVVGAAPAAEPAVGPASPPSDFTISDEIIGGPTPAAAAESPFFLERLPKPEQPEPEGIAPIPDYLLAFGKGVVGLGQAAYGITDVLTGGMIDRATGLVDDEPMSVKFQRTNQILREMQSPAMQAKIKNLEQQKGFFNSAWTAVSDPALLAEMMLGSGAFMLGGAAVARGAFVAASAAARAAGLTRGLTVQAANKVAVKQGIKAATLANIGYNGVMEGASSGLDMKAQILTTPEEKLGPVYENLKAEHGPAQARLILAETAQAQVTAIAGVIAAGATALTGAGKFEAEIFTGQAFKNKPGRILREMVMGARELPEETAQNVGQQLAQNIAARSLDPTQDLTEGLPEAAGTGAAFGLGAGIGFGAMRGVTARREEVAPAASGGIAPSRAPIPAEEVLGREEVLGPEGAALPPAAGPPVPPPAAQPSEPILPTPTATPIAGLSKADMNRARLRKMAEERRRIDMSNDTLLMAVAKLGGANIAHRLDITGDDKNMKVGPFMWVFTSKGLGVDDLATQLGQYGYLSADELSEIDGGVQALRDKIRDEFNGLTKHYSLHKDIETFDAVKRRAQEAEQDDKAFVTAAELEKDFAAQGLEISNDNLVDYSIVEQASAIDSDAVERLSIQHEDNDAGFMAAIEELIRERSRQETGGRGIEAPAEPAKPAEPAAEELALTGETEAEVAAAERDRTLKAAEEAKTKAAAEAKAKADIEAKAGLVLTGSERPADIAVAAGQQGLFAAPPPTPTIADIHAKADSLGIKWDDDPAFMDRTEALTGKRRLDFLSGPERKIVFDALEKPAPAVAPTPVVTPKPGPKPKPAPKTGDLFGVDAAAVEAATSPTNEKPEPTEGQKEEGNYPKGHWRVRGLDISIENPAGSRRRPEWPELKSHYGYIRRTEGKDGDQVDVFVKPGTSVDFAGPVFIVDQNKANGHFDEHKVMLGWPTVENARAAYLENYTPDWDRIRAITSVTMDEFKDWLTHPEVTSKEPASDTFAFARGEKIGFEEVGKQKVKRAAAAKLAQSVREAEREIRRMALTLSDVTTAAELPLAEFRQRAHDAVRLWVATERETADKSGDTDRVSALAGAKLEGEFYDSIYRELRKSVRAAEIEKNRDPAIYQAALAAAMVEENISNDAAMQAAFKGGFDHAIAGNTKSTLIGDLLGVRTAGYDRAMAWMSKDEGRNYFQGKRGKKLEGTGAALRRWFDDAKKTIADAKGSPEAFLDEIDKATTRADAFKVEMAPGATPGLARWLDDLRGQFMPFKEWVIRESSLLRSHGGSPTESVIYFLKDNPDRMQDELRELAETYVSTLTKLAGLLSGKANIAQAAEALDAATLGPGGVTDKDKPLYKALHPILRKPWRLSIFGSKTWQTKTMMHDENAADVQMRKQPLIRPRLDKISREGRKDYRKGRNVTPKEFKETFGFADVGFGKWVGTKADQDHLNYAFDAFMDLADTLGLKPKDISLGGTLYFSIGALGHGRASAHFAPEQPHPDGGTVPVINVTSTRGDGSVAHEWHHALDFHLRPKEGGKELIGAIKKELQSRYDLDQVRTKVISALKGQIWWTGTKKDRVVNAHEAIRYYGQRRRDSNFFSHAKKLGEDYWADPDELFARASEAWVYDTMEGENPYLVSDWVEEGKVKAPSYRGTPYPEGEERIRFAGLYKTMYQVLDWTDTGPVVNPDKFAAWPNHRGLFLDAVAALEREIPDLVIKLASEEKYKKLEAESKKHAEADAVRAAAEAITVAAESNASPGEDDLSTLFDEAAAELREGTQEQPNAPTPGESGTFAKPFRGGDKVQFREGTNKQIYEVWIVSEDGARIKIHEPAPKVWRMAGDFVAANEDVQALLSGRGGKIPTADEKRAGALAAEAAKLGVQGVDEALKGLVKLFGGNKIKSFPAGLDREAYEQAKPHFEAALKAFQAAGRTLKDLFKFLIQNFGEGIKPYAIAFAQEKQLSTELTEASVESASMKIAKRVAEWLSAGQAFKADQLFRLADVAFDGTQAQGVYTPKDAFDAMEAGVQLYLRQGQWGARPETSIDHARRDLENMERFLATLPTQTKRTAETDEFQQFSTPPTLAYIANWAANVRYGETYLEPSAGIGGLAIFGEGAGARVILNELSQRRAAVLREVFPRARVFSENAEQLHNILPDDVNPTVIVMNPPFSSTAGRIQGARDSRTGAQHLEQALARLAPGGRVVAIMGDGMNEQAALLKDWWARMRSQYNFRANVSISGDNYVKYGTTFDNRIIVVDKTGPTNGEVLTGRAEKLVELFDLLSEIRNDGQDPATQESQPRADQQGGARPPGEVRPDVGGAGAQPGGDLVDAMGAGGGVAGGSGVGAPGVTGEGARPGRPGGGVQVPGKPGGRPGDKRGRAGGGVAGGRGAADVGVAVGDDGGAAPVTIEAAAVTRHETELTDAIFESYKPQRLTVLGSKPHPGELVESAAMSAVVPPAPTYQPNLPEKVIRDGLLSDAQIEVVVYAGQAFQDFLPNGDRKGYFIGDGTGVGKGREISGIILDHFRQGQKKAVWISEKQGLLKDAQRDFSGVTGDPDLIFAQSKTAFGGDIKGGRGILFTTYSTLRSVAKLSEEEKKAGVKPMPGRADQIVKWVGPDFDGVVVFDESHAMANAQSVKGKRGATKASAQALAGIDLQKKLPKARIVYVSATGATEVFNLAYASRLGLWGEGTPFAKSQDFISKIDAAGVSAMEIVAQNMKQMGVYVARSLSFRGVKYDQLPHDLTPLQTDIYNELARAWQIVLANINAALEITHQEKDSQSKSIAKSQFWSSQQRFFNQIITAMQMPSVIEGIKADMAAGRAAILQFVNTNEAEQERQAARIAQSREDDDTEIEEFDFTPRQTLLELIRKSFPVNQYEEYKDEDGNIRSRPVLDSNGDPVQNKEAVAMREALLKTLEEIRVPDNPLDMVVEVFGSDAVAEISGRKRRFVRVRDNDGNIKLTEQKRGSSSNEADKQAFLDGKKNILAFTDAGGTGYSFHADLNFKNQKLRRHYLVQSGWRADKAVQGLGRSHRTNQKQPPHYVLPRTNLKAQKRFISSIARRLDQLGALTKGQRQAASQGVFSPADNLENKYARMGLRAFLEDLVAGSTGLKKNAILRMMGLEGMVDDQGQLVETKMPPITQFLNRLLSLEVHVQDQVFDEFFQRVEAATESAIQNGTFDDGLQTIKAISTTKTRDVVVYTDKKTDAVTRYVELTIERPTPFFSFDAVAELTEEPTEKFTSWYLDNKTGKVFALFKRGSKTDEFGKQVDIGLRIGPSKRSYNDDFNIIIAAERDQRKIKKDLGDWETRVRAYEAKGMTRSDAQGVVDAEDKKGEFVSNFTAIDDARARDLWADETAKTPKTYTEVEHMITGAMLPIWDRLPESVRVARTQTSDGERLLGRLIQKKELNETLKKLGVGSKFTEMKPAQWFAEIKAGAKAILSNGWQIKMAKVSGEQRMEISGLSISYSDQNLLVEQGAIHERIQWKDRLFIPVDRPDIFERIVKGKPVIDLIMPEGGEAALSRAARVERGLPQASVEAMVDRLTRDWTGAPEIVVVETPRSEGVPSGLLDLITVKGAVDTAEGAFHEDKIYLFSRHMRDAGRVQFVILHEATHFGLRGIFGEAIDPLLMEIYRGNENVKTAVRDLQLQYRDLTTVQATEEVLADLGGKAVELSGWERLVSFIRNWLRARGFTLEYSIGDIRALVESAGRFTREGRTGVVGPSVFSPAAEEIAEDAGFALSRVSERPADRIDEYRFQRATDKRGLPIYHNEHIGLAGAVEEGKSATTRMILFKIYDTAMSVKAGAPAEIGFVRSEIDGDGNFVNVHSIRISDFYQQSDKGYGEDVIASMLASNAPGKSLEIIDIVVRPDEDVLPGQAKKDARGFWQKLGTVFSNLSNDPDVPMYGFLTLSGYVQARSTARLSRGGGQKPTGLEAPRRTGLLDILLRVPMQAIRLEKITARSYDFLLGRIGAFVPEGMKAGLVSDYGLTLDYIERRDQAFVNVRRGERDIKTIVDALTMLDRAQSRVAYQWMTQNETEGDRLLSDLPAESQAVLIKVKGMIVDMGREAVRLGQLGQDSFERNVMSYLHRTYAKYELADEGAIPAHRRAISILGEQYKGRGMTQEVTMAKIRNAAPEWWERKVQSGRADKGLRGMKFIRFDRRANRGEGVEPLPGMEKTGQLGKILEVVYWPAEHSIPTKFGEWHRDEGLWEARDTKGDKLLMWRDFTKAEREKMGELDDVKYSVAKTLHMMQRDLEVGRFLEWLASHYAKPEPEGEVSEASERLSKAYRPGTWVHVPVSKVPGTNTLRYGKLAGLYVPGPIWNDIRQIANQNYRPFGRLYGNVVKWFKISKTALSPVVHMNNVMANFIFADVEDITGRDLWDSMKVYLEAQSGDEKAKLTIQRFEDSGATSGMFVTHELYRETVEPMLKALREEVQAGSADVVEEAVAFLSALAHGRLKESATRLAVSRPAEWARRGANAMMDAYQFEDEFFRLAVFLRETAAGKSDLEAGKTAKQAFLDYNINAPWIQAARHTALPFISFSYRALPRLLHGFSRKPWKLAKYMLVAGGLNAIAYAMLGLSDDDEERERAFLPDEKAGRIWGIVPKLIRMPWNDQSDQPVFLDVRRWIPLGDIFDTGETQAAIPFVPTLVPGGPLAIIGEIIFNKSLFTGKPLTNRETDTMAEISGKISEHVYKSFAPNAPWIPFSYAGTALVRAGTGRTDVFGREQSFAQAGLSSFGIKVSSYAPDVMQRNAAIELQIQIGQIKSIMYQLAREYSRHGMGRDDYEKKMAYQREKMERLTREFAKKKQ